MNTRKSTVSTEKHTMNTQYKEGMNTEKPVVNAGKSDMTGKHVVNTAKCVMNTWNM